jgi:hypothetical protein
MMLRENTANEREGVWQYGAIGNLKQSFKLAIYTADSSS